MRKGPYPLSAHLGMLALGSTQTQQYVDSIPYNLSENNIADILSGIQCYRTHPYIPAPLPYETVWTKGNVSIKRPAGTLKNAHARPPILFVPSLINKAHIFDIHEEYSMLRWFGQSGRDIYLLDWGDFTKGDNPEIDIEILTEEYLLKSILEVSNRHEQPIDILGYCMGGTLLMGAYSFAPEHIRRMTLLAAPWDFHASSFGMAKNIKQWCPYVLPLIEQKMTLPTEWMQSLFASFDPKGSAQKFVKFPSMDQSGSEAQLFVSVEDWLNDGVDLPKNIAQHCIQEWFLQNAPIKGAWKIGKNKIDLKCVDAEILVVASTNDHIVPAASAFAIIGQLTNAKTKSLQLDKGHIGMIVGRNAKKEVWQPILSFFDAK